MCKTYFMDNQGNIQTTTSLYLYYQFTRVLLKQVGFSLLMAAVKPALAVAPKIVNVSTALADATSAGKVTKTFHETRERSEVEFPVLDVNFCGECVPFEQVSVLDRWKQVMTTYGRHNNDLERLRERSDKVFPLIEPILERHGIPNDFLYVPVAESSLNGRAVSRVGAAGYWQLMPGTARDLGLKVGKRVDERFNLEKATDAACRYIRQLYDKFGSWSLVAAAYNAGPGYVNNQLVRHNQRDYYQMNLPKETRLYLYRILFYKEILTRPESYVPIFAARTVGYMLRTLSAPLQGDGLAGLPFRALTGTADAWVQRFSWQLRAA